MRGCLGLPSIHRFLWSRLNVSDLRLSAIPLPEPRPKEAVDAGG